MDLEKTLQNFGISPKEARVYLAALELGEALPKRLATGAGIKRTTLYEMLPALFSKGLFTQVIKGKRRFLMPEDPQRLIAKIQADLTALEQAKPEFLALFNKTKEKPKVFFFDGVEGIKRVYENIIESKRNVRAFVGTANINDKLLEYLKKEYESVRIKKQIFVRNIANENVNLDQIMPRGESLLRENRVISAEKYPISIEIVIYGDKIGYMTIRKDSTPIALLVENKEIADSMRSIFEIIWSMAKKK